MVLQAQEKSYMYLRRPVSFSSCPIPADELREHFRALLQSHDTVMDSCSGILPETSPRELGPLEQGILRSCQEDLSCPLSLGDVSCAFSSLRNKHLFEMSI